MVAKNEYGGRDPIGEWPPWPNIWVTFERLLDKLEEVPPEKRVAIVDWWIGQLFVVRSAVALKTWPERRKRRR